MSLARWPHRLRRLLALPAVEVRDLAAAQWYLLVARVHRRWSPLGRYVELAASEPELGAELAGVADAATMHTAQRAALAIERAAENGPIRTTCLERAVALDWLLRSRGIASGRIRVGVRWYDGQFLAHAWVELGELVLADAPGRVRAFDSIADAKAVTP